MKNTWRKLVAAFCAAAMLIALPGVSAYAADSVNEDSIVSYEEIDAETIEPSSEGEAQPGIAVESTEAVDGTGLDEPYPEEQEDTAEKLDLPEEYYIQEDDTTSEETVGSNTYTVGDGVTATFDPDYGILTFSTITGGTLWKDWLSKTGLSGWDIKYIRVASKDGEFPKNRIVKLPANSEYIFAFLHGVEQFSLKGFDTSNVTNMYGMFYQEYNIKMLDLSTFNTSKVTNMSGMFDSDVKLTILDLSSFNTSKVTDMSSMFNFCNDLTSLDVTGFDTSNVTTMYEMFCYCEQLKTLNVSSFNTSKVTSMERMFSSCEKLSSLDLSKFDTSKVTNMNDMFGGCKNLTSLKINSFKTSNVTDMAFMFAFMPKLTTLRLLNFNTQNLDYAYSMFEYCENLKYLDIGNFDMSKSEHAGDMLTECNALDILITPKKKNKATECKLPHTMYDRNGKAYSKLPVNEPSKVLGRTRELAASIFIDVRDPSHAYYDAIYWAADNGITKGYSDGTFGINRSCTRGEMVMFLWRYAGQPLPKKILKSPFKDVSSSHTFYKAILWAYQNGITKGYPDGTFGIDRNVTRGESMMFLWRLKGKPEPMPALKSPFSDVPKNHTFYKAILWGYQKKVTTGYTSGPKKGTFGINENCTRGQIVTFLYRARNL